MTYQETNKYFNSFFSIIPLGGSGGPENFVFGVAAYVLSPQILLANCISFSKMVTHLACIAHKFESSRSWIR